MLGGTGHSIRAGSGGSVGAGSWRGRPTATGRRRPRAARPTPGPRRMPTTSTCGALARSVQGGPPTAIPTLRSPSRGAPDPWTRTSASSSSAVSGCSRRREQGKFAYGMFCEPRRIHARRALGRWVAYPLAGALDGANQGDPALRRRPPAPRAEHPAQRSKSSGATIKKLRRNPPKLRRNDQKAPAQPSKAPAQPSKV